MFRVDKLNYFEKFHCVMGECPENCCETDWNILVDPTTYTRYQTCGEEFVRSFVTQEVPYRIIKKDRKCPFFQSDGLCMLHKMYGEGFLCETCRNYPRFTSAYGELYIVSLALSCPAVLDILWGEEKSEIQIQVYYESREELGEQIKFPRNTEAKLCLREELLDIVQKRELSLSQRGRLLLNYPKMNDDGEENADGRGCQSIYRGNDYKKKAEWLIEFINRNCMHNKRIREQAKLILEAIKTHDSRGYADELESAYPEYRKFFEHILFYSIFEQIMKERTDGAGWDWMKIICLRLAAVQYWLLYLYKAKGILNQEDCNIAVYSIMRVLDHGEEVKEDFWQEWNRTGFEVPELLW